MNNIWPILKTSAREVLPYHESFDDFIFGVCLKSPSDGWTTRFPHPGIYHLINISEVHQAYYEYLETQRLGYEHQG